VYLVLLVLLLLLLLRLIGLVRRWSVFVLALLFFSKDKGGK
jgi:hypothetical protein